MTIQLLTLSAIFTSKALEKSEFVVEAVTENELLKRNIFTQLSKVSRLQGLALTFCYDTCTKWKPILQITAPETILASNTSSISITRLAAVTAHPQRVVRVYFAVWKTL